MATDKVAFSFYKRVMERRKIKRAIKVAIIVCIALVAGYMILNMVIKRKIRQQFTAMSPFLVTKFSKVHTNVFASSVSFDSLDITFAPYINREQNEHHLSFSTASLNGISFLKLLFNKNLEASALLLENGNIQLDSFLLDKKDSAQLNLLREIKWPFKKLYLKNVQLKNAEVSMHSEDSVRPVAKTNIAFNGLSINKPGDNPSFDDLDLLLSDLDYQSHGYRIQASRLSLNSNRQMLELDSLQAFSLQENQNEVTIPSLRMKGFDLMRLLNEKKFIAADLLIDKCKIAFFKKENSNLPALPVDLKKIEVDNFQCNHLSVSYKDKINECRFNADISLSGMAIDSFNTNKMKWGSVDADVSGFRYSGNNYHAVDIKKIEINSRKELVQISDINITPQVGKYEFGKKLGHQADWMQAFISKVDIIKPEFNKLFHQELIADKIKISKSTAYIFRDRRLPRPQKNIPLPVDVMRSLPIAIRVKTCELATSAVVYEEYPRSGYGATGILKIEKLNFSLSPFINRPTISDPAYMKMNVEGSIMGSGTTHGAVMMPLQKNKPYYVKGVIEKLELTRLNSSSENLGKIRIKSGFLDFLYFDFTMTDQRSTGKIIGAYHRLIIQQLKKHTDKKNIADFASFALRHAIIPLNKDASLPERKRTGKVDYQRDPTRMVSYYFLQSLLMGVKKSFTLGFLLPK